MARLSPDDITFQATGYQAALFFSSFALFLFRDFIHRFGWWAFAGERHRFGLAPSHPRAHHLNVSATGGVGDVLLQVRAFYS